MKKSRINKLIPIANKVLRGIIEENGKIKKAYDGKVTAFGVTVALSGLLPALAMYFKESTSRDEVKTRLILDVIARIIVEDKEYTSLTDQTAKGLMQHAIAIAENTDSLKNLTKYVLEAAIALKQTVRTYELI